MGKNRLSLCMIVKDEEANLNSCLESVRTLVDEIIVVDTGSTDRTKEIAHSHGAITHAFPWNNDFSSARNESLKYATGEWILVLDADEVLDVNDHTSIRQLIDAEGVDAYRLVQRTYQKQSTCADWISLEKETELARGCHGYITSHLVRLFRNNKQICFKGRVHEQVEIDLLSRKKRIVTTDIPIHHYGNILGPDSLKKKQELYLQIGYDKLKDQPFDDNTLCELGVVHLELGQVKEAEKVLRRAYEISPKNIRAAFNFAIALYRLNRMQEASEIYERIIKMDPTYTGAYNNLSQILERQSGTFDRRKHLFVEAIHHNPRRHTLRYNYGVNLERENLIDEAEEQYMAALDIDPDFELAKKRLEILHGQEPVENSVQSLNALVDALEKDPDNCELHYECGKTLEKLGQIDLAIERFQDALALSPGHSGTLFQLASTAWNQGLLDECIRLYEELLTVMPEHSQAHFNLACALVEQGEIEKALYSVENALNIMPGNEKFLLKKENIMGKLDRQEA
ncbi:MAG: tetratricopeptide repeat protein [Candidatus Brocadiales bacterium]|nr:tetratricopeptide repeat protein [Candidatus Brocadiales bacterium]